MKLKNNIFDNSLDFLFESGDIFALESSSSKEELNKSRSINIMTNYIVSNEYKQYKHRIKTIELINLIDSSMSAFTIQSDKDIPSNRFFVEDEILKVSIHEAEQYVGIYIELPAGTNVEFEWKLDKTNDNSALAFGTNDKHIVENGTEWEKVNFLVENSEKHYFYFWDSDNIGNTGYIKNVTITEVKYSPEYNGLSARLLINNFENEEILSRLLISKFKKDNNHNFYKLGLIQKPPKIITIGNYDD